MAPVYKVLDDLSFIMECLLQECFSDGRSELQRLANRLENDSAYAIQDREAIAAELRDALSKTGASDRRGGYRILSRVSRELWAISSAH